MQQMNTGCTSVCLVKQLACSIREQTKVLNHGVQMQSKMPMRMNGDWGEHAASALTDKSFYTLDITHSVFGQFYLQWFFLSTTCNK